MLKPVKVENEYASLKTNLVLWAVYSTPTFKAHMSNELSKCLNLNIEWIELGDFNLEKIQGKPIPDLVYIETGDKWAQKVAHVYSNGENFQNAHTSLIVFGDEHDTPSLKMALRLGASDYFSDQVMFEELYPLLKEVADDKVANRKMGSLTLFLNTKGGSGATTLALNTAIELAGYAKSSVLLVDLDMRFSDSADYLDCKPKYSINSVIDSLNDLDEMSLEGLVHKHHSGLNYLGFDPLSLKDNHDHAGRVSALLPELRQYYAHIIVDMSGGVEHMFQKIVSPATRVFLVMQQNVISVKHASQYLRSLEYDFGLNKSQIELLVNRYDKKASISTKDIEKAIPNVPVHMVPNNFNLAMECANLGSPIVQSKKNSALKSSLAEISHKLEVPDEENASWIKKLFS